MAKWKGAKKIGIVSTFLPHFNLVSAFLFLRFSSHTHAFGKGATWKFRKKKTISKRRRRRIAIKLMQIDTLSPTRILSTRTHTGSVLRNSSKLLSMTLKIFDFIFSHYIAYYILQISHFASTAPKTNRWSPPCTRPSSCNARSRPAPSIGTCNSSGRWTIRAAYAAWTTNASSLPAKSASCDTRPSRKTISERSPVGPRTMSDCNERRVIFVSHWQVSTVMHYFFFPSRPHQRMQFDSVTHLYTRTFS